ncbi:RING finger domain-containing protein [uncultured Endozoicomonas sp.]|uniref:RING finger domain-containing protein n=1 Tax=uncultured Endozoicomonas sp. TaxID=432652 RepID=UPI002621B53A|nr:RING finger domain-containing protein [uncultured Endozoicomonas sp.]
MNVTPSDGLNCSICWEPFDANPAGEHGRFALPCSAGHVFGRKCIATWIKDHNTCPLDRENFTLEQRRQVNPNARDLSQRSVSFIEYQLFFLHSLMPQIPMPEPRVENNLFGRYLTEDIFLSIAYQGLIDISRQVLNGQFEDYHSDGRDVRNVSARWNENNFIASNLRDFGLAIGGYFLGSIMRSVTSPMYSDLPAAQVSTPEVTESSYSPFSGLYPENREVIRQLYSSTGGESRQYPFLEFD